MLQAIYENEGRLSGNIYFKDIKRGQWGLWGTVGLKVTESKKTRAGLKDTDHFIFVDVTESSFLKKVPNPEVGDRVSLKYKLATLQQENSTPKIILKCISVISHTSKNEKECLAVNGFINKKPPAQQNSQPNYSQQEQDYHSQLSQQRC